MADTLRKIWAGMKDQDPGPVIRRIIRVLAALFLFLIAVILYAPALGDTRFVFGTDTTSHDYIMHYYGWEKSIGLAGELPLWNPYLFNGIPMIASAALCPFYPSQWLYFILPFNTAFTLQYVLAVALGGIGAAWWMRCLGLRRSVCLWAGLLYMVSGHFITLTHAGHLQKMIALGWAPFALGATMQLVRISRAGGRSARLYRITALLGIALGMQMLASHPQILYGTAAACFLQLIGMAIAAKPWRADGNPTDNLKPIGQALGLSVFAIVVCCAISAVQLFPTMEMNATSNRAEGVSWNEAVETSYPPLEIFEYVVPALFGNSVRGNAIPYYGDWGERIVSDYIGLPVALLALLGLFGSKRKYRWYLLIVLLASLLIGLGRYTPVYWLLYHTFPGFSSFRSPGSFMFLANCAIIGLASLGLNHLITLAQTVNNRGWQSSMDQGATDPSFASIAAPPLSDTQPVASQDSYDGTDTPPQNISLDYDEYYVGDENSTYYTPAHGTVTSSNFSWDADNTPWLGRPAVLLFLVAIAITALVAAIIALGQNYSVNLKTATDGERMNYHVYSRIAGFSIALMLMMGGILLLRLRTWIGATAIAALGLAMPLISNYDYLKFEPLTPFMAHLTRNADLLKLSKEAPNPVRLVDENLLKNDFMLYGVGTPAGYHPIVDKNYSDALGVLHPLSDGFGELFAVNYARTGNSMPPLEGSWVAYDETSSTEVRSSSNRLWRRTDAAPYIRNGAELVEVEIDDLSLTSSSLRAIAMTNFAGGGSGAAPAGGHFLARLSDFDVRRYRLYAGPQMAEGTLQRWTPQEIRIHTNSSAPNPGLHAVLPISEPYAQGWYAETSTGRALPILDVNGLQRGIVLPNGSHNIRLVYSPFSFRLGLFLTLIAATILTGYGLASLTRRALKGKKRLQKILKPTASTQS